MRKKEKIVYLNNYMSVDIAKRRKSLNIYSQPANNKILGIVNSLESVGVEVRIFSSGLVNSKTLKWYKRTEEKINDFEVVYCSIWDCPLFNTLVSAIAMFFEIYKENRETPIDNIIFYNYKPEVAWAAWLANKMLNIPITIEFEDGYSKINSIKGLKRLLMILTESIVSKSISSAITVNSLLVNRMKAPCVVIRGVTDYNLVLMKEKHKKSERTKPILFYGGGLDTERGVKVLLESLQYVTADFKIIITGKGSIEVKDERIEFKGFIEYEKVLEYMLDADILIQCQLSRHQFGSSSFPSKIFEYMATGNLIISSEVADIKNFAGDAFYYYENDDPKLLAEAIENAIKDIGVCDKKSITEKLSIDNLPENIGIKIMNMLSNN